MWRATIGLRGAVNRAEGMPNHPTLRTPRAQREINAGELEQLGSPVRCANTAGPHLVGPRVRLQDGTRAFELRGGVAGSKQAVVTDLHEATWEDVEQEAPNELVRREGHAVAALGHEANAVGLDALQALIGETHAVGVAAEVPKDLLRPAEGALGVDDPLDAVQRVDELLKRDRIRESVRGSTELQLAVAVRVRECRQELPAKDPGEHLYREQVAAAGRDPLPAIDGEAATGHDAVHVRVKLELAGPGVQDGGDAEVRTEPRRIAAEREQSLSGGLKEKREDPTPIAVGERPQRGGQSEDDVEVVSGEESGEALLDPRGLAQALALGAVAVATGIVGGTLVPTAVADVHVSAERSRTTRLDGVHRRTLVCVQCVPLPVRRAVGAEDVGDLQDRAGRCRTTRLGRRGRHGYSGSGSGGKSSRSRGLRVCPICRVLIWV